MKQLFTSWYCPKDCDRKPATTDGRWYTWGGSYSVGDEPIFFRYCKDPQVIKRLFGPNYPYYRVKLLTPESDMKEHGTGDGTYHLYNGGYARCRILETITP